MGRKYSNPPIEEALCEFQFVPSQPWDITIPGLFYDRIKEEFPEKQQQMGFGLSFQPKEGGIAEHKIELAPPRMQFFRTNKSALVQVGPNLLTINHLRPYPSWENFKPLILDSLMKYQEITKPKGLKRIGLRYINKIEFNKGPIELSDYFNYYPFIPQKLPQIHSAFNVRIEIPYEGGRDHLLLALASMVPEKPDVLSLLLDIDYIMAKSEGISLNETLDWIENAHTAIENAFEACITDRCRNLFGEVK